MADKPIEIEPNLVNDFKETKSKTKFNSPILIFIVFQTFLISAIGYGQLMRHLQISKIQNIKDVVKSELQNAQNEGAATVSENKKYTGDSISYPIEPLVANLAQSDGPRRFLRLTPVLNFSSSSNELEFKENIARIKDLIITLVNTKRPDDLLTAEGKVFFKEQIQSGVNSLLKEGKLIAVYFVNFQIN